MNQGLTTDSNEILKMISMLLDPKSIALQFNEYITNADVEGLSALMTEDHVFNVSSTNTFRIK